MILFGSTLVAIRGRIVVQEGKTPAASLLPKKGELRGNQEEACEVCETEETFKAVECNSGLGGRSGLPALHHPDPEAGTEARRSEAADPDRRSETGAENLRAWDEGIPLLGSGGSVAACGRLLERHRAGLLCVAGRCAVARAPGRGRRPQRVLYARWRRRSAGAEFLSRSGRRRDVLLGRESGGDVP